MREYHDTEWGVPSHDDAYLFELLTLEGAQAGLSWSTVLNKRENYREATGGFDLDFCADLDEPEFAELMQNAGIVRNRLKITSLRSNAIAFRAVQAEFGSFETYLWSWVDAVPVRRNLQRDEGWLASSELSDRLSKDLKKRGFRFVGTTITYAFLQAVGVIEDHVKGCLAKPAT